jgi:hypothetical protein
VQFNFSFGPSVNSIEALPKSTNIPPLTMNIEGLKRHSFILVFFAESALSPEERRLRSWLLHTLAIAARQYMRARELVVLQERADQATDGGEILYLLDVSEQLEGCVMALHRVFMALRRMRSPDFQVETGNLTIAFEKLISLRNQFEHMHMQIVQGETGKGPISITFASEGGSIRFRDKRVETSNLRDLLQAAFFQVSSMYPQFDPSSAPELGGPMKLTVTGTIQVLERKSERRDADM